MNELENDIRLSVIIPTFEREDILVDTVGQVIAQAFPAVEIMVIDQTSNHSNETERRLKDWESRGLIRWLRLDTPHLCRARNKGIAEAKGQILLFLDDDIRIPEAFLKSHLELMRDETLAAVTGQVLEPGESPADLGLQLAVNRRAAERGFFPLNQPNRCSVEAPWYRVSGGNFSIRRHIAITLGGFDERFSPFAYSEDCDFGWRLYRSGYKILFSPRVGLTHYAWKEGGRRGIGRAQQSCRVQMMTSKLYFLLKHRVDNPGHFAWGLLRNFIYRRNFFTNPISLLAWHWYLIRGFLWALIFRAKPIPILNATENTANLRVAGFGNRNRREIALTFDDGPNPYATLKILDILDSFKVKATFFVLGSRCLDHPEILKQIEQRGHLIGNHSFTHQKGDFKRCDDALTRILGKASIYVRPPYFHLLDCEREHKHLSDKFVVMSDIISDDYGTAPSEQVIAKVVQNVKNGSIIDFHDGSEIDEDLARRPQKTIEALPEIIKTLLRRGFNPVRVDEMNLQFLDFQNTQRI